MKRHTVASELEKLRKPSEDETPRIIAILEQLPPDLDSPTISNLRRPKSAEDTLEPEAWLSFHGPSYDPDNTFQPVAVLEALERHGWRVLPASLVKWNDYRAHPEMGLADDIPETKPGNFGSGYKLSEVTIICPAWVVPNQYGKPKFFCYMVAPSGQRFKVMVDVSLPVHVDAKRVQYFGGWHYDRSRGAQLRYPPSWETLEHAGEPVAQREAHSRAYVDTEQGCSGVIYWEPIAHDQDAFPMTASQFLAALLASK